MVIMRGDVTIALTEVVQYLECSSNAPQHAMLGRDVLRTQQNHRNIVGGRHHVVEVGETHTIHKHTLFPLVLLYHLPDRDPETDSTFLK